MPETASQNSELSPIKQALLEIRRLNARLSEVESRRVEPVAITGIGLRFPGANSPEAFWQMLTNGIDAIEEVPPERWDLDTYYSAEAQTPGKMNCKWGGFLREIDQFDPHFFGISPREASSMDPQQRLLLETTWEALERAGQSPEQLFGSRTGVFLGISNSDYYRMLLNDVQNIDAYVSTGNALSVAGGRLSYTLGLRGPNVAIDTACSSSLVALHLACKSLRDGESDLALAGGVNLILLPELTINFSQANMMAPDGRCKTFDAAADGYVRGEGCGMVVLKRLSDALSAGDPILAVIRGTAINHDGRSGGLTAPNGPAQVAVIQSALANAGVSPHDIRYVETHGTGTSLGDPIEVGAVLDAFCQNRPADRPLVLGAVKTNVGHLEAAAGIAGVIKAVLSLQHQQIPPNLHFSTLNPHIELGDAPLVIPVENMPWPAMDEIRRVAGVSSFGLSGTNAHIVLEEAPERTDTIDVATDAPSRPLHLLALSGRGEPAVRALAGQYESHLASTTERFEDICYSANTGRSQLNQRLAVVAKDNAESIQKLRAFQSGEEADGIYQGRMPSSTMPEVTFLFTGHGSTYARMGQSLYESQPIFREVIERCDAALQNILGQRLIPMLYPPAGSDGNGLADMRIAQPALFSLQMALAELWKSWGVEPTFVMGHSAGEYAAACLAGIFSLEDALKLVCGRGEILQSIPKQGYMVAIFAPEEQVAGVIASMPGRVSIAALNAPTNTVISGESDAVEAVVRQFEEQGVKTRRLAIGQAAHSPLIEPALDGFQALAETVHFKNPAINLVSTLTGSLADPAEITRADYWRRHLRQPVQFVKAMQALRQHHQGVFLEIGPNPVLISMAQRFVTESDVTWLSSLRENRSDWEQMLENLSNYWLAGGKVDWATFDHPYSRRKVVLPTYPFQRSRFWTRSAQTPAGAKSQPSTWQAAAAAARRQSQQGPFDLNLPTYAARWEILDRLTSGYMIRALTKLGIFCQNNEAWTVGDLLARAGIQPTYDHLIIRWLEKLTGIGLLQKNGDIYQAPQALTVPDLTALTNEANAQMADSPMVMEYIQRCSERLPGVLTGKISALDTLFPGGSGQLAEDLYQNWALSRYYGILVGAVAESSVQSLQNATAKKIRVLELGAGTGATTSHVLPVLPPEQATYAFTDISDLFLSRAAEKFSEYPFVQYQRLDIEKSPAEQGFPPHSFDLVIATNVLHAIPSLRQALAHTLELLAPGGLLIANEVTTHLSWFDITTGLIEGWQSFSDDLRSSSPLIAEDTWLDLLKECGFIQAEAWPKRGTPPEVLGQHVIVAQAPYDEAGARVDDEMFAPTARTDAPRMEDKVTVTAQWVTQLQEANPGDRLDMLLAFVRKSLKRVLRLESEQALDRGQRLMDLGLDSLMALELRSQLTRGLGLGENALSATLAFDYPTILALATYLLDELLKSTSQTGAGAPEANPAEAPAAQQTGETSASARQAQVADLTDDEVEALLMQKLNQRKGRR